MSVFIGMTSVLAESCEGDRKTYLKCMAEEESEDLVKEEVIFVYFAFSYLSLYVYMYDAMTRVFGLKF